MYPGCNHVYPGCNHMYPGCNRTYVLGATRAQYACTRVRMPECTQDLAVAPLLVILPLLAGQGGSSPLWIVVAKVSKYVSPTVLSRLAVGRGCQGVYPLRTHHVLPMDSVV